MNCYTLKYPVHFTTWLSGQRRVLMHAFLVICVPWGRVGSVELYERLNKGMVQCAKFIEVGGSPFWLVSQMRPDTGNLWREYSNWMVWENLGNLKTSCAAAFSMSYYDHKPVVSIDWTRTRVRRRVGCQELPQSCMPWQMVWSENSPRRLQDLDKMMHLQGYTATNLCWNFI